MKGCFDPETLHQFVRGLIDEQQIDQIYHHVNQCSSCARQLAELEGDSQDPLLNMLRQNEDPCTQLLRSSREIVEQTADFAKTVSLAPPATLRCPKCDELLTNSEPSDEPSTVCQACGTTVRIERPPEWSGGDIQTLGFGRFEQLELIGKGGFGTVYRAVDTQLHRLVALKVPHATHWGTPADEGRFFREARTAAQLSHPHIVPVFEVVKEDPVPFIVAEYVHGETLATALQQKTFSMREIAEITLAIAQAIEYSHQKNIIHRDLKPSNIMLRNFQPTAVQHEPCVMDFGLARLTEGDVTITADGCIMGTPAYAPPEQLGATEQRVDGRSDVYSIGVMLYEMLAGELPFRGKLRVLVDQVLSSDPRPPRQLNDRIPKDLETICLKCLEKDPARRYQSAAALADDLSCWLTGQPISARPVSDFERFTRWCFRNPGVALPSALALLFLIFGTVTTSIFAVRASERATLEAEARQVALAALEDEEAARKAEQAARNAERVARLQAEQRQMEAVSALYSSNLIALSRLHADGQWGQLRLLLDDMRDDPEQFEFLGWEWSYFDDLCRQRMRLFRRNNLHTVRFSPSQDRLAVVSPPQVIILDAENLEPQFTLDCNAVEQTDIAWSPDGGALLVGAKTVTSWNMTDGTRLGAFAHPPRDGVQAYAVSWSPDLKNIVTGTRQSVGVIEIFDVTTGKLVKTILDEGEEAVILDVKWSPDGATIASSHFLKDSIPPGEENKLNTVDGHRPGGFYSRKNCRLGLWDASSGENTWDTFKLGFGYLRSLRWADDGRLLLTGDGLEIWRGTGRLLNVHDLVPFGTIASGTWLTGQPVVALANDRHEILLVDDTTGNPLRTLNLHGAMVRDVDWSSRKRLASTSANWLAVIDDVFDPDPVTWLTQFHLDKNAHLHTLQWSPDGKKIAMEANNNSLLQQVKIWNVSDPELLRRAHRWAKHLPAGGVSEADLYKKYNNSWDIGKHLCWSPDGHWIAAHKGERVSVHAADDLKNATKVRWTSTLPGPMPGRSKIGWSTDGQRIAVLSSAGNLIVLAASDGALIAQAKYPGAYVSTLRFSPQGRTLAYASGDAVFLMGQDTVPEQPLLQASEGTIFALDWSPGGDRIAISCENGTAIYDVATSQRILPVKGVSARVSSCSWSPDGQRLALGTAGGEILIINPVTGRVLLTLQRHRSRVLHLSWSPDSKRLLSGDELYCFLWGTPEIQWPVTRPLAADQHGGEAATTVESPALVDAADQQADPQLFAEGESDTERVMVCNGAGHIHVGEIKEQPEQFTCEFWLNPQAKQKSTLFRWNRVAPAGLLHQMDISHMGINFSALVRSGDESPTWKQQRASQAEGVNPYRFIHVAGVWDGTQPVLYIDGQKQQPELTSRHWGSKDGTPLILASKYQGLLHQFRLSSGIRYQDNFTPEAWLESDSTTLVLYHFAKGQGKTVKDFSENDYEGTVLQSFFPRQQRPR